MTWYDVYVARADDPAFTRSAPGPSDHNCPDPISPVLYDRDCFDRIVMIGEQMDWGCWVRVVDKSKILEIFENVSGSREMADFLDSLGDTKQYAVVARET
jgi:hypothetical protein